VAFARQYKDGITGGGKRLGKLRDRLGRAAHHGIFGLPRRPRGFLPLAHLRHRYYRDRHGPNAPESEQRLASRHCSQWMNQIIINIVPYAWSVSIGIFANDKYACVALLLS